MRRIFVGLVALGLLASGGQFSPVDAEEGTHCVFDFIIVLDPGLSMMASTGQHYTGEPGTLECHGPVNGLQPTGTGTLAEDGAYGTADPDSCMAGGEGDGTDHLTVPTASGPQQIHSLFTVTFGKLSNKGGLFHGEFTGSRFTGSFEFSALEGDCVTAPVTKARVKGDGVIHS
jgi:hypothetical protein